jgi:hypothetical protein
MCNKYVEDFKKYRNENLCPLQQHIDFIWRKRYKPLIFIITLLLILVIVFIGTITYGKIIIDPSQKIYDIIILITAAIVFWYSRETADLKDISNKSIKELRKQVFLEQRPFIRLQWIDKIGLGNFGIRIINEGFGIATNVILKAKEKPEIKRSIIAGEKASKSYTDAGFEDAGLESDQKFLDTFKPSDAYKIDVLYLDVAGNKYSQLFIANDKLNDKFELLEWDLPEDFEQVKFKRIKVV